MAADRGLGAVPPGTSASQRSSSQRLGANPWRRTLRVCFDLGKNRPKFCFGVVWQTHLSQAQFQPLRQLALVVGHILANVEVLQELLRPTLLQIVQVLDMPNRSNSNGQGHIGQEIKTKKYARPIYYLLLHLCKM